jgi:anti-anti-sigma factor
VLEHAVSSCSRRLSRRGSQPGSEADIIISGKLRNMLDTAVARQPGRLIIDMPALRFMDSSALHVILAASKTLAAAGGAVALAGPGQARPRGTALSRHASPSAGAGE